MAIERQYPTQDASLSSDASWDSLEGQIDGIESEALFDVAAAPGVAVGLIGTITVSAVSGSAVQLTPNAERREALAESSIGSDQDWDSLENRIDSLESEALFAVEAAPEPAAGAIGTITISAVYGSAVELTPHAERRERLAEASLDSDASWDSLEGQLDGIESEALFLGRVDAEATGAIGTVTVSAIEGTATGETLATGSKGGRSYRWILPAPPIASPVGAWIRQREEEEILLLG